MIVSISSLSLMRLILLLSVAVIGIAISNSAWAIDPVEVTNNLAPSRPPSVVTEGERPLWEVGLGVGGIYSSDYPGSDRSKFWVLPVPYAVYRGSVFKSDKEGTRACWLHGRTWEFNFSGAGSLPSSSDSGAREGMPKMEWLGEAGPAFSLRVFKTENRTQMKLNIPIRGSVSTDLHHAAWRGFVLAPNLILDVPLGPPNFNMFGTLGADFADRSRMGYYYDVDQQYATADRSTYHAKGGFLRATASLGFSYEIRKWDMSLYSIFSHDSLAGAANEYSPLVKETQQWSGGVALTWRFLSSKTHVKAD